MTEKVDPQSKETKPIAEGEIRVTTLGRVSNYVTYAKKLLSNGIPVITIRGTGRAMSNVVETAEILRHMINGLHQVTTVDTQDRLADGKSKSKDTKFSVCFLTISLSLDPSKIDTKSIGYQAPLTKETLDGVDVDQLLHSKRGPRSNSRRNHKAGSNK
ncbi:N4 [Theileria parva strain Muguga]|uniref:N4 n=1 Tax=Theileria parva strain Muguga TaxID=333668 RepID=UPI001C61E05C|nr:N4 [Theileria parva strain Muguga]EAN30496.2 N4 [Theileria parva strain Muguga]